MLSDHGQTQGATFKQRNGYGLDELSSGRCARRGRDYTGGDEQAAMVGLAVSEATGPLRRERAEDDVSGRDASCSAPGTSDSST